MYFSLVLIWFAHPAHDSVQKIYAVPRIETNPIGDTQVVCPQDKCNQQYINIEVHPR